MYRFLEYTTHIQSQTFKFPNRQQTNHQQHTTSYTTKHTHYLPLVRIVTLVQTAVPLADAPIARGLLNLLYLHISVREILPLGAIFGQGGVKIGVVFVVLGRNRAVRGESGVFWPPEHLSAHLVDVSVQRVAST